MTSPGPTPRPGRTALLALALLSACSRPPGPVPVRPGPAPEARALPRLGFTLQAGAFAEVEHAARFAEALQARGLEATYYAAPGGLYRVRFGDFATRAEARARGEALKAAGTLESYWVVTPERPARGPERQDRSPLDPAEAGTLRAHLVETAQTYLGVPYLFGGTTPRGFDCSGLTGAVYRLNGLRLPRSSMDQFEAGRPVALDHAQPGDLLFFATAGGRRISHVGLYLGHGAFIHAPSEGRRICEDRLDERYYRETFVGARTYL